MDYVIYDDNGKLLGGYSQELAPNHITCHIEVSAEQRINWVLYQANSERTGIELAPIVAPAVYVPQQVSMMQGRLALHRAGLLSAIDTAIAALSGDAGDAARIEWQYGSYIERNRPLVQAISSQLGLSDSQLDDLFVLAATL